MGGDGSKLDLKIARDALMRDIEPLWEALCSAVDTVVVKLKDAYDRDLLVKVNEQNTVLRVIDARPIPGEASTLDSTLELRLDRRDKKLVASISDRHSRAQHEPHARGNPRVYKIAPDDNVRRLCFAEDAKLTAAEVAEREIAEKLLKMDL